MKARSLAPAPPASTEPAVDSAVYSPSVDRALEILECLGKTPDGFSLSELSARLGFPKNAVFRITNTLRARGYLARDERSLKFLLTERLIRISQPRFEKRGLIELSMDAMRGLRDTCQETVQIGRRMGDEGVILEQVEAKAPLRICVDPGLRFALYNNAPGKLLLASLPDRERAAMIERLRPVRSTARTITDKRELARECDRIRELGYAVDLGEADEGIHCLAAPVLDGQDEVIAALWVSGPSRRLPKTAFPKTSVYVKAAARQITDRIRAR